MARRISAQRPSNRTTCPAVFAQSTTPGPFRRWATCMAARYRRCSTADRTPGSPATAPTRATRSTAKTAPPPRTMPSTAIRTSRRPPRCGSTITRWALRASTSTPAWQVATCSPTPATRRLPTFRRLSPWSSRTASSTPTASCIFRPECRSFPTSCIRSGCRSSSATPSSSTAGPGPIWRWNRSATVSCSSTAPTRGVTRCSWGTP